MNFFDDLFRKDREARVQALQEWRTSLLALVAAVDTEMTAELALLSDQSTECPVATAERSLAETVH